MNKTEAGVEIEWIGGNCPVQADGTFNGEAFYFRARGSSVTCTVGEWEWRGPEYEWPGAGWISNDMARAFIAEAYRYWLARDTHAGRSLAEGKRRNDLQDIMLEHIRWAVQLDKVPGAAPVIEWHMEQAKTINEKMRTVERTP